MYIFACVDGKYEIMKYNGKAFEDVVPRGLGFSYEELWEIIGVQ